MILVSLTASAFRDPADGPRYHVVQVTDITSRDRAEQALRESESAGGCCWAVCARSSCSSMARA